MHRNSAESADGRAHPATARGATGRAGRGRSGGGRCGTPGGSGATADTGWQRYYRLVQNHVQTGGTLPEAAGDVVMQGKNLGRWVTEQRHGWEQLLPVQQWILESTLTITPRRA